MNDNESILAELRKIAAWAEMQRKITKWSLIGAGIFVCVFIPGMIVMEHRMTAKVRNISAIERADWYDVDRYVRCGNLDEAIRIGEELIQRSPQFPEGHRRLASAYLVSGDLRKAREHFAEAVRLFPSDENEKLLIAIDTRIKAEVPRPQKPANPSSRPQ